MPWLYLEPILSNDDGELGVKFRKVDQGFRQVTRILEADARLSALLQSSRLQPMLDSISEQLLACQSALNLYIEEKRSIFPRLYFLSDDDLLELLGQAQGGADGREVVIQTHLKKLFPGITSVRLGPGDMSITALCSHYGEAFHLDHPVDIDCPVEVWLKNLETEMRVSLKNMTLKCLMAKSLQEHDPFTLPTQILCLAQNLRFTEQAEKAIASKELHKLKDNIDKENSYYASTDIEDESERRKRQALILQCAHYLSVIRVLIDNNVVSTGEWLWQKQLRFYLLSNKEVVAKMGLAKILYSYEYLGVNTGQFVRTELADDCFFILTQSLHLGLVGNPFGPAGTGKTESVKALGSLVGRLVLIFNCDEAMDSECMGRLLSGVAVCGAWGCFDEFNRLAAHTLAAVSHQLTSLLGAITDHKPGTEPVAILNGKHITVSGWCGVAATMNPAGRGYGGRRDLPAALQRLFRPIAMLEPPHTEVAAHLLAANCVPDSQLLATDLNNVFTLASSLLSEQRHYDWGLRALKAAVSSCAASAGALNAVSTDTTARRALARRVLTLNNMSKLTTHDAERFENILSLVFNGVPVQESSSDPINAALESTFDNLKLVHNKLQVQKCMELYEQLQQRMGVVIVGPPGSGKTTIRRLLKTALTHEGKNVVEYIISPKAMNRDWLLGSIDHDTRQWTDGVISSTALHISNQPLDVWSWVVCDGDIDPEWIEALNSVLDDNRLLTLPSGWRIQFGTNVNFLFETHSLEHASPATVSRMGIILLSENVSCDIDVLSNWIQRADFDNENAKMALPLLQQAVSKCIHWLNEHKSDLIWKINNISMVKKVLTQFEYIAQDSTLNSRRATQEEMVYLAIERSVVDVLKENAIDNFREEMSLILGPPVTSDTPFVEWVSECLLMSRRLCLSEPSLRACLMSDTAHLLIVGPDASAKNILAEHLAKECNSTLITIDCTPILEPADIIAELKRNNLVSSGGRGTGGVGGRGTLVVRALHRAYIDTWRSTPVHSFLLQLIQHNGFWSRGSDEEGGGVEWWQVAQLRVIATTSTLTAVDTRLAANLLLTIISQPDDDELLEISTNYMKNSIGKGIPSKEISSAAEKVLALYKETIETFDACSHYKWNASHLKKLFENIKWYSPTNTEQLITTIVAEANFIFRERLVLDEEKTLFDSICRKHLKVGNESMHFAYKLRTDGVYLELTDYNDWYHTTQKLINQCLSEHEHNVFGESGAEVCAELTILCPAMARAVNGGLLVCVGCAGVGRTAAAHIVAAALPATLFIIKDENHFNNIFKNAMSCAGEGTRTLALICAGAVTSQTLPALEALRRARSLTALPNSLIPTNGDTNLLTNIKENLGIVLCLDKNLENLSQLMVKYPLLHNEGTVVWLDRWCDDTLRDIPRLIVQRLLKENALEISKEQLDSLPVNGFVSIHKSIDVEWKRAPCRYVNFVKTYYNVNSRKKTTLLQRQTMLSAGLDALRRARIDVARLQSEAAVQEVALREAQAQAEHALQQISATVRANTEQKEEMQTLKRNTEIENEKLQAQKKEIEAELASVEPIIAAARAAVGDIRPESLSEVRSLRAPPEVVRDVLEGVLRLMGIADTSWHSMKNFLSKRGVKEDIRCLDARQISPAAIASVQRLLESRGSSFDPATAKRASAACAPLAAWVRANLHYAAALQRVQPLQAHQASLHRNLMDAEQHMAALSSGLTTVEERVAALQTQLGQHTKEAAALELKLTNANNTITAATNLLDQLAHEYTAWETDLENISVEISQLTQRSLLSAAYIVYLPDKTEPQAREYITKWSALIDFDDSSFSIINFLSTTEKQLKWQADGLPSDTTAVKNAVLLDQYLESQKCGFTPLIIDPDGEGLVWLRNTLADTNCDFVSQRNEKLMTAVQYAARLGRTVVITEVETVSENYVGRIVLQCRSAPKLAPHVAAVTSPLNFTHTLHALTDQLVHFALQQQNPEVDAKSKEIKLKKATLQKQQHELQENLLRELSNKGDILQDAGFLASLSKTRATNDTIAQALAEAREIERVTRAACEAFEPAAERAATLTLATNELAARWPLVALPVDFVHDVFVDAVRKQSDQNKINSQEVIKHLTRKIIERVLLSLHKKDKYIVVLYLLKQVYDELIPSKLWQLFIGNYDLMEEGNIKEFKEKYSWLPEDCAKKVLKLKMSDEDIYNKMCLDNESFWKEFQRTGDINVLSKLKLNGFETVVVVASTRPDSLYRAIVAFVSQILGAGVVSSSEVMGRGRACAARARGVPRPILLLASHAHDVLVAAASGRLLTHIGIGEGRSAWESALETCRSGGWLAIIVGASPFKQELQNFITAYLESPAENYHEEFRLWILSEDREIPSLISNACVNVILESPEGVKNNVMSTLSAWGNYRAEPNTIRLHAALALFHALVQERRAYIPQGWSRWYAWEWGEVVAGARMLNGGACGRSLAALYSARVCASADERILAALQRRYLSRATLAPTWKPLPTSHPLPTSKSLQDYIVAFDNLPDTDTPALLALPANCRVAWEKNTANDIVSRLKELNSTVNVRNKSDGVTPLKSLLSLWKKLMSGSPFIKGEYHTDKVGSGWWWCVCEGEARDAARVARALHMALAQHARTRDLPIHHTSEEWQMLWCGPVEADAYVRELGERARDALHRLEMTTQPADYMPTEVDLRSFLRPSRVIWALRVHTASRLGCPIHTLVLSVKWGKTTEEKTDGLVVVGLRACGAEWREGGLAPAPASAPPHTVAPPLRLRFVPQQSDTAITSASIVDVPVYSDSSRSMLVLSARAPLASHWDADSAALHAPALYVAPYQ